MVSPAGVVGRVVSTSPNAARVLLLEDPSSGVDVLVQRSRARGIVEGSLNGGCQLKYIKHREDLRVGDRDAVHDAPGVCAGNGREVRDAALARSHREVEAQRPPVEPRTVRLERPEPTPLDERRRAEVAAVGEVPEVSVVAGHAGPCMRGRAG